MLPVSVYFRNWIKMNLSKVGLWIVAAIQVNVHANYYAWVTFYKKVNI